MNKTAAVIPLSVLSLGQTLATAEEPVAQKSASENKLEIISIELSDRYGLYIVKPGDTLAKIAKRFGKSVETLLEWNPHIMDPTKIDPILVVRIRECR
ncbi:MAG: hypothetical protein SynsKO_21410 [Synoicihabitans sp.]